jgi:hypothetical protein
MCAPVAGKCSNQIQRDRPVPSLQDGTSAYEGYVREQKYCLMVLLLRFDPPEFENLQMHDHAT